MKIAVPTNQNNLIDGHFGHCEFYTIFTINEDKKIVKKELLDSPQGCGCKSNIAEILKDQGVTLMLVGGIGQGAVNVLAYSGVDVIMGCSGDVTENVNNFLAGNLFNSGEVCSHHEHGESCGHHN
ncbi:MAG: NifB/NifX family molybdenum-iron cluster-binding protein [Bacteroidota bacterium]|nr:NifB/NifX family molybdenum-iron cluster-binding protein [Bacteroidota bacterium]